MKIKLGKFRVREGETVKLQKWPTKAKPFYKSKEHYQEILAEHARKLSYPETSRAHRVELQATRRLPAK